MTAQFHPLDAYSRLTASGIDGTGLVENYEHARGLSDDAAFTAGAMEVVASVAIARVLQLEKRLATIDPPADRGAGTVISFPEPRSA